MRSTTPAPLATASPPVRLPGVPIVDDDVDVRRILSAWLGQHGFAVWVAADGGEAVGVYRAHRPSIDLALLDVRMPGRDGPETLAALRDLDPHVRACFMTGDTGRYTTQGLLDMGALAIFRKPFRLGELAERLAELTPPADPEEDLRETRRSDGSPVGPVM